MEDRTTVPGDTRLQKAVASFDRATALDPSYALAYAQAGYANAWIGLFNDPTNPAWIASARRAADTAIRLDPQLAQPYQTRYELYWSRHENFNITQAIRELHHAQRLDPTVGLLDLGTLAAHLGLADQATRYLTRTLEIDPTNLVSRTRFVEAQVLVGRYSDALSGVERLAPSSAEARIALAMLWTGDLEAARVSIDRDVVARPTDAFLLTARALWSVVARAGGSPENDVAKGIELAAGSRAFHHVAYNIATLRAVQGRQHDAVEWLKKTVDAGMPNYPLFSSDPPLRGLRGHPEYVAFMADLEAKWNQWRREFETDQR
jgi:tetratricopeptide (TPR) repeat protein